jgi:hypothetical protein
MYHGGGKEEKKRRKGRRGRKEGGREIERTKGDKCEMLVFLIF